MAGGDRDSRKQRLRKCNASGNTLHCIVPLEEKDLFIVFVLE